MYYFCIFLIVFVRYTKSYDEWDYSNLRCRNNERYPVDWWYIYKPPLEVPILDGTNFTYILPDTHGRWQMADVDKDIINDSMLQYTLEPLFRETDRQHLAYLISHGKIASSGIGGSSVYGIMVANENGGFWIGHSIPDFIDLIQGNAEFPKRELPFGHVLMCLSLDLPTLNLLGSLLKEAGPKVQMHVPNNLRSRLLFWKYFNRRDMHELISLDTNAIDFETVGKSLPVHVMVRRPKDKTCLYTRFARKKQVILDVYKHDPNLLSNCVDGFGVRQINSISLKIPNQVFYIPSALDKMGFAVNTAAYWQTKGSGQEQYWACISTIEKEEITGNGGIIVCVQDYNVWWSFDNLKIKEPNCYILVLFLL